MLGLLERKSGFRVQSPRSQGGWTADLLVGEDLPNAVAGEDEELARLGQLPHAHLGHRQHHLPMALPHLWTAQVQGSDPNSD